MYVVLAIIYLVSPMIKESQTKAINDSIITKALYNNNIILNVIV